MLVGEICPGVNEKVIVALGCGGRPAWACSVAMIVVAAVSRRMMSARALVASMVSCVAVARAAAAVAQSVMA